MNYYWLQYFISGFMSQWVQFHTGKCQTVSTTFIIELISSEKHRSYYTESSFFWKVFEQSCLALLSSFWHRHGRNTHRTHFKRIRQLLKMFLVIYWLLLQLPLRSSETEGARRYFSLILHYNFSGILCEATCMGFLLWLIFPIISVTFSYHKNWEGKPL